jgi:hypothetical protein
MGDYRQDRKSNIVVQSFSINTNTGDINSVTPLSGYKNNHS